MVTQIINVKTTTTNSVCPLINQLIVYDEVKVVDDEDNVKG